LTAVIILGGMPESAFFIFLLVGAFSLVYALSAGTEKRSPRLGNGIMILLAAGTLGLLISSPLVLTFMEYLRVASNPRSPGIGALRLAGNTAISLIIPKFFGQLHKTWTGVSSFLILPYVGSACCVLAISSFCQKRGLNRVTLFLGGFSLFCVLKIFGSPVVQWIAWLPLFNMAIFPKHAFPEFALCIALLAGMGAEGLLQRRIDFSRFGIACLLLCVTVAGFTAHHWRAAAHVGAVRSIGRGLLIFAVNMALIWALAWAARKFGPKKLIAMGLIALPAAELIAFIPKQRTRRYDAYTVPPFVRFLRTDPQPYRTFSADGFLYPDTNAAYGISDIRSLDPINVERYMRFIRSEISSRSEDRFDGGATDKDVLKSRLLNLMNVKYVLTASDLHSRDFISELLRDAFILPRSRWGISETSFTIDGIPKEVLFQHPPSRIDHESLVAGAAHLKFALALDPKSWEPAKGSGVVFRVEAASLSAAEKLFSEYIDPKNRPADRKWNERSIDLSHFQGQEIYLIFQTRGGTTNQYDWAHWAQLPGGIPDSLRSKLEESQVVAAPNYVVASKLNVGGRTLDTWTAQPPATVRFRLRIPKEHAALNFAIALDPAVWKPEFGDGVTFEIFATPVQTLFTRAIDPKNKPEDRKWHPADIDLSSFRDQRVLLTLNTLPEGSNAFDWAGWGDLRLETERGPEKFSLVYDGEVKVYRNNEVLPRAFVVNRAEVLTDKDAILERLSQPNFDASKSVILEESVRDGPAALNDAPATAPVTLDRYEPNYIRMHSTLEQPGWLVLTDTYYPGWKVRIDGKQGRILPADYMFRAVALNPGAHVIEFIYRPTSFLLGVVIGILTILFLLVLPVLMRMRARSTGGTAKRAVAEMRGPGA
jgi:Bacterial membrane protein YfhO